MWNLHLKVLDHFIFLSFLKQMFDFSRKSELQEFAINSWNSSFLEKKKLWNLKSNFLGKKMASKFLELENVSVKSQIFKT